MSQISSESVLKKKWVSLSYQRLCTYGYSQQQCTEMIMIMMMDDDGDDKPLS
jgi:hypothetical protein